MGLLFILAFIGFIAMIVSISLTIYFINKIAPKKEDD